MQTLHGNIVDPLNGKIFGGTVQIRAGRITSVAPSVRARPEDGFILPGFVDAHMHVESSMLPPTELGRAAVRHGTVAIVADPHEIANVLGVAGIRYMIDAGKRSPIKFSFGAPACVPATEHETSGARLDPQAIDALLADDEIRFLGEVMNYPAVVAGDRDMLAILDAAKRRRKPIDGHAPGLAGEALERYAAAGISTDHECATIAEARARVALGMSVQIREGSAARDFDVLHPLLGEHPSACMFCSDDRHPDDIAEGHVDALVRRALAAGYDPIDVLKAACVNPVLHYGLDVGLLRVGDPADLIVVDDLRSMRVRSTMIDGVVVAERGASGVARVSVSAPNVFEARPKRDADFYLAAPPGAARVIAVEDGQLRTTERRVVPSVESGRVVADIERDLLPITVVNRYRDAPPAVALASGFGLQRGAIASSVAHDSHNIVAVGTSEVMLAKAVNAVIEVRGGIAAVDADGVDVLPLPIAGLMSLDEYAAVGAAYERLNAKVADLGSPQRAPFMTLSFMALLVMPELKIGDRGLFDVLRFTFVDVAV